MSSCAVGQVTTGETHDQHTFDFSSSIGGTDNPVVLNFTAWQVCTMVTSVFCNKSILWHTDEIQFYTLLICLAHCRRWRAAILFTGWWDSVAVALWHTDELQFCRLLIGQLDIYIKLIIIV